MLEGSCINIFVWTSLHFKVIDFIIKNIASVKVNNTADLLQSSSVIGSALHVLEKVSPESLVGKIRSNVYQKE